VRNPLQNRSASRSRRHPGRPGPFLFGFITLACASAAFGQAYTAEQIQSALDQDGYFQLPPGKHRIDRPIELDTGKNVAACPPRKPTADNFLDGLLWT